MSSSGRTDGSGAIAHVHLGDLRKFPVLRRSPSLPHHPYTQGLLLAAPQPDPFHHSTRVALEGEPPSPLHPPAGCRFHTRCPLASDRCRQVPPPLHEIGEGHWVACHHHDLAVWPPPAATSWTA